MTKRRLKNAKPTGANKSLGNALQNRAEKRYSKSANPSPYIIEERVRFKTFFLNSVYFSVL